MNNTIIQLPTFDCPELRCVCHADIVNDHQLVITIDYESKQFVIWKYLEMTGMNQTDAMKWSKIYMDTGELPCP